MKKRPRMAHWEINLITTGCGSEAQTWVWWYSGWCKYSPHYIYFYYDWMDWKVLKLYDHYGWKLRVQRHGFVSHSTKEKERQVCPGLKVHFWSYLFGCFKIGPFPAFFSSLLSYQYSWKQKIKFPNEWTQTADLWCHKRPLFQLNHNHCPIFLFFGPTSTTP